MKYQALIEEMIFQIKTNNRKQKDAAVAAIANHGAEVKVTTLLKAYQRIFKNSNIQKPKIHSRNTLTSDESHALTYTISVMSKCSLNLSCAQVRGIIKRTFKKKVSQPWVSNFIQKNSIFSLRRLKKLSAARSSMDIEAMTEYFIEQHQIFLKKYPMSAARIFNFDESRVGAYQGKSCYRHTIYLKDSGFSSKKTNRAITTTSILPVVSADGMVLVVYYIIPGQYVDCIEKNVGDNGNCKFTFLKYTAPTRSHYPEIITCTDTGFVDQKLFVEIFKDIAKRIKLRFPDVDTLFLGDNCGIHHIPETIVALAKLRIFLNFLPPNTTHFLQPLDKWLFARFKAEVYILIEEYQEAEMLLNISNDKNTSYIAQKSMKAVAKADIIKACFRDTGIWPFSPEIIRKNLKNDNEEHFNERERLSIKTITDMLESARTKVDHKQKTTVTGSCPVKRYYLYGVDHFKKSLEEKAEKKKQNQLQRARIDEEKDKRMATANSHVANLSVDFTVKSQLLSLTAKDLTMICRAKRISGFSSKKKESLADMIVNHQSKKRPAKDTICNNTTTCKKAKITK